jgi:hypothetical protein
MAAGYAKVRCLRRRDNIVLSVHFDGWSEFLTDLRQKSPGTGYRGV